MISDDELLAACRAAGRPGTDSHREACRLYRQSVAEWQARARRGRREDAGLAAVRLSVALLTMAAVDAGWLSYAGCGTHDGYNKHARDETPACLACLEGERDYSRARRRIQRRAKAEDRWRAAA